MIFLRTNYVILVIFYGFLLWGFFDNEDDLFCTLMNTIYVDNIQGILEHVSDFLYL